MALSDSSAVVRLGQAQRMVLSELDDAVVFVAHLRDGHSIRSDDRALPQRRSPGRLAGVSSAGDQISQRDVGPARPQSGADLYRVPLSGTGLGEANGCGIG